MRLADSLDIPWQCYSRSNSWKLFSGMRWTRIGSVEERRCPTNPWIAGRRCSMTYLQRKWKCWGRKLITSERNWKVSVDKMKSSCVTWVKRLSQWLIFTMVRDLPQRVGVSLFNIAILWDVNLWYGILCAACFMTHAPWHITFAFSKNGTSHSSCF